MGVDLLKFLDNKELDKLTEEDYSSTMTEWYNDINESNLKGYVELAIKHYELILLHSKLSGYFIVDWRINFYKLFKYCLAINEDERSLQMQTFLRYHDEESTDELYKRLDVF